MLFVFYFLLLLFCCREWRVSIPGRYLHGLFSVECGCVGAGVACVVTRRVAFCLCVCLCVCFFLSFWLESVL